MDRCCALCDDAHQLATRYRMISRLIPQHRCKVARGCIEVIADLSASGGGGGGDVHEGTPWLLA
jgi:hypothetical protein